VKLGYARVSTKEQNLDRQIDSLKAFGCEKIWQEKVSAAKVDLRKTNIERPELEDLIKYARKGDTIVVHSLSRLARSIKDLLALVDQLTEKGVGLKSLTEDWLDTSTPQGKLLLTIFGGLAEFERDVIRERTVEGLKSARARGRLGGRPKADRSKVERALMLYDMETVGIMDICKMTGISKPTLYKYLKERDKKKKQNERS
jgi:DNA invertase Pin-like site-specific DNA recombinase